MIEEPEYLTFVPLLLREVPELLPLYEEHLQDNRELLSHVFMGDVTRFVVDTYYRTFSDTDEARNWSKVFDRTMEMLEHAAASSDHELVNLVIVSFCENLLDLELADAAAYQGIRDKMGPRLTEHMDFIREYWNRQENQ